MGNWRTNAEQWLSTERQGLDDSEADAAFAAVFAALPAVDPSPGFARRAAEAAWVARRRRRWAIAAGVLAATVSLVAMTGVAAYVMFGVATGGWLVTTAAMAAAGSAVSMLAAVASGVQWWLATAQAGNTVADVVALPQNVAALFMVTVVGVIAFLWASSAAAVGTKAARSWSALFLMRDL